MVGLRVSTPDAHYIETALYIYREQLLHLKLYDSVEYIDQILTRLHARVEDGVKPGGIKAS